MIVALFGYLLGSVPFGLIVARAFKGVDPRQQGSGNIGFTNVLRVAGATPAAITLVLDVGKGALPVALARARGLDPIWSLAAGALAVVGHIFPAYLRFRGGKGVATGLGAVLAIEPILGLIAAALWLGALAVWRISSLAAVLAFGLLPAAALAMRLPAIEQGVVFGLALLIVARHRCNLLRLWKGIEPKIGRS